MCGIAGFINYQWNEGERASYAQKMLQAIHHRGPDNSDFFAEDEFLIGQNRLSIIDLSEISNQPFFYAHLAIVFNGEIYNYIELRAELMQAGYQFSTQGDTEVIAAAYLHWGKDAVTHFLGMWAIVIYDRHEKTFFCSRDRFGIKPFLYYFENGNFYFASEFKALRVLPSFDNAINEQQAKRGIALSWASYKDETFYKNVKQLKPAHNLIIQNKSHHIFRYWDLDLDKPKTALSWEEKKAQFHSLFKESIQLHARSDVKNGTLLSGGLDSSAISSIYSTLFPAQPIQSFSIYYEGKNTVDERPFINAVVDKYPNIEPNYFSPNDTDIAAVFSKVAYSCDVPLLGSSFISQYFLMQLAKSKGVTVVINGQGADEYLGGYMHSFYRLLADDFSALKIGNLLSTYSNNITREGYGISKSIDVAMKSVASLLYNEEGMYNLEYNRARPIIGDTQKLIFPNKSNSRFDNFLYYILTSTTLQTLLHFEDRNSMAFSLESRVPFLNHKLIEFCFGLTDEDRINTKAVTKYILRESLKNELPEKIYARKDKKGFVTPGEIKWLDGPLKFLLDIDVDVLYFLNKDKVKELISAYKNGDKSDAKTVWRLVSLHYWIKNIQ